MLNRLPDGKTPTNSVPINVGTTAAEGQAQGDAANRSFNDQLDAQFRRSEPGNGQGFYPKSDGQGGL